MKLVCSLGLFGLCLSLVVAQDSKETPSTGQKGELVPSPFRSYIVVDNRFPPKVAGSTKNEDRDPKDRTNKMHCLVSEHGLNPVVAIFVRQKEGAKIPDKDSGVAKLAIEMNKLMTLPEYRGAKLATFVIFMRVEGMPKVVTIANADKSETKVELDAEYPEDENRDKYAGDIKDLADGTKTPNVVFGLAPIKAKAASNWGIADDDEVTVVLFNRIRVVDRWKFKADAGPTDDEIKAIVAATEESVTGAKK